MYSYRTVIVDDEPIAIKAISIILEKNCPDFSVVGTAANGQDAYDLILHETPDLVLTDIAMPLLNGVELAAKVREILPDINFVVISGYQDFEYMRAAIRSGVLDYLSKPIAPSVVLPTMDHVRLLLKQQFYQRKNLLLYRLCNGIPVKDKEFLHYFPYQAFYVAIIRKNGLPRRLADTKNSEIYADIDELYSIYGRDSEEELFLIPTELLAKEELRSFFEKTRDRQFTKDSYSTILYYSNPLPYMQIHDSIGTLYRQLDTLSCVGVSQLIDLNDPQMHNPKRMDFSTNEVDTLIRNLEFYSQNRNYDGMKKIISTSFDHWIDAHRPQLWMEYASRQILSLLQREHQDKVSVLENEYMLEDVFFNATDAAMLKDGLFTLFFRISEEEQNNPKIDSTDFFAKVESYLLKHLAEPISLHSLSDTFAISQAYMSKLFRKYSGVSYNQYFTKIRMEKAKQLMQDNPELYVKDIASLIGYSDQFYFSRIFRTYTGKAPSEYLESLPQKS